MMEVVGLKRSIALFWFLLPLLVLGLIVLLTWHENVIPEYQVPLTKRYIAIIKQDTLHQDQWLKSGIEAAAKQRGVYVQVTTVSNFEEQDYEARRALYSGFDGMILMPIENSENSTQLLADIGASIPCLELLDDQDANNLPVTLSSSAAIGQIAALQLLSSQFTDKNNLHIFIGDGEDTFATKRAEVFEQILRQYGYSVDGILTIGVDIISSDEQIKEYIRDNHVDYIFCADELGTIAAAKCAYSVMYQRPYIIGCGNTIDHTEYFDTGEVQVLISIDYETMGEIALEYLDRYCSGIYLPSDYDLCITIYNGDNSDGLPLQWSDIANG